MLIVLIVLNVLSVQSPGRQILVHLYFPIFTLLTINADCVLAGPRDKFWCVKFHPQLDVLAKTAKGKSSGTNVLTNERFPPS